MSNIMHLLWRRSYNKQISESVSEALGTKSFGCNFVHKVMNLIGENRTNFELQCSNREDFHFRSISFMMTDWSINNIDENYPSFDQQQENIDNTLQKLWDTPELQVRPDMKATNTSINFGHLGGLHILAGCLVSIDFKRVYLSEAI